MVANITMLVAVFIGSFIGTVAGFFIGVNITLRALRRKK